MVKPSMQQVVMALTPKLPQTQLVLKEMVMEEREEMAATVAAIKVIFPLVACGAGWNTDGSDGLNIRNAPGEGGLSPSNGSIGGEFTHPTALFYWHAGDGGFGGGGGMSDNTGAGGGGGGYNGGGGGNNYSGASEWEPVEVAVPTIPELTNNTAGVNAGHGKVVITRISYTFTNAGATGVEWSHSSRHQF